MHNRTFRSSWKLCWIEHIVYANRTKGQANVCDQWMFSVDWTSQNAMILFLSFSSASSLLFLALLCSPFWQERVDVYAQERELELKIWRRWWDLKGERESVGGTLPKVSFESGLRESEKNELIRRGLSQLLSSLLFLAFLLLSLYCSLLFSFCFISFLVRFLFAFACVRYWFVVLADSSPPLSLLSLLDALFFALFPSSTQHLSDVLLVSALACLFYSVASHHISSHQKKLVSQLM